MRRNEQLTKHHQEWRVIDGDPAEVKQGLLEEQEELEFRLEEDYFSGRG